MPHSWLDAAVVFACKNLARLHPLISICYSDCLFYVCVCLFIFVCVFVCLGDAPVCPAQV